MIFGSIFNLHEPPECRAVFILYPDNNYLTPIKLFAFIQTFTHTFVYNSRFTINHDRYPVFI